MDARKSPQLDLFAAQRRKELEKEIRSLPSSELYALSRAIVKECRQREVAPPLALEAMLWHSAAAPAIF